MTLSEHSPYSILIKELEESESEHGGFPFYEDIRLYWEDNMPWGVAERGDKWVVYKEGTGEVVGSHDSKEKAAAHQRALYANVKE